MTNKEKEKAEKKAFRDETKKEIKRVTSIMKQVLKGDMTAMLEAQEMINKHLPNMAKEVKK